MAKFRRNSKPQRDAAGSLDAWSVTFQSGGFMSEVEYIPVSQQHEDAKQTALALIAERSSLTPQVLREMSTPRLRILQRHFYRHAQNSTLLRTLKEAVAACGTLDPARAAKVWRVTGSNNAVIEAALDTHAGLHVTVDGVAYCDDRRSVLPRVIFLPDDAWILPMLEAYEEAQFVAEQERALNEDAERLALIGALTK
jgi:hypothetical protein